MDNRILFLYKESILEFKKRSQKKQLIDHIEEFLHSKGVNHGKV